MKKFCSCFLFFATSFFGTYDVAIISMFHNDAPYIKEWVEYHHMIGVEHFWLYNDASEDNWEEVLKPYIDKGIVEVFYWPAPKPCWVPGQISAFKDGLNRALGNAKWVTTLDQDEFILPMKEKNIYQCLKKHFSSADAVYMSWRHFGTNDVIVEKGKPLLCKLKACSARNYARNATGKSFYRPEKVITEKLWYPHHAPLKPQCKYLDGDGKGTLKKDGDSNWTQDGKHHDKWIRINHYPFRDENYFRNVRLKREHQPDSLFELYHAYNEERDKEILKFIKKNYPEKYKEFWKKN